VTKQESHLFCRIAVHNKLVSVEDANACLREALREGKNVAELFVKRGLLTVEQARKILRAVKKHTQAAAAAGGAPAKPARQKPPPSRAAGRPELPGRRRVKKAKPVSQSQFVLSIASIGVLLIVLVIFVILWQRPPSQPSAGPAEQPKVQQKEKKALSVDAEAFGPGKSASAGTELAPPKPPELSEEEKKYIQDQFNKVLSDARRSIGERPGQGVAALDNFLKSFGDRISPDQRNTMQQERNRLVAFIRKRFEADKKELLAAKAKGDSQAVSSIYNDIRYYADGEPETMKELEELVAGTGRAKKQP